MADSKEYLRELLQRAIPDRSGDIVNFRELRNLLEASIDSQTRRRSRNATRHDTESDGGTHYLPEADELASMIETSSTDEIVTGANSPKIEIESEKIEETADTEDTKHIIHPVERKVSEITENQPRPSKKESNRQSFLKDDQKSSSNIKRPSVSGKSAELHRNSLVEPEIADFARSSRAQYSQEQTTKAEISKTPKDNLLEAEYSKDDSQTDGEKNESMIEAMRTSSVEKHDNLSDEEQISSSVEIPSLHTPVTEMGEHKLLRYSRYILKLLRKL